MTSALTIKDNQMQKKWYTIYNILHIKMTLAHAWAPTVGGKKGHLPPPPPWKFKNMRAPTRIT